MGFSALKKPLPPPYTTKVNNRVHTILVENCQRTHEVEWDAGEDLITRLIPEADIPRLIRENQIRHSIIVAALHYFVLNN